MADTDLHPRAHSVADVLRRVAIAVHMPRRGAAKAPAGAEDGCPGRLDAATMHDIGACPAYRDYASRLTLGAGSQPRLQDLSHFARWGAVR